MPMKEFVQSVANLAARLQNIKILPTYKLSFTVLKLAAAFFMTYDHILKYIYKLTYDSPALFFGRLAFPLFGMMIAWHLVTKKNFKSYLIRIFPIAVVSFFIDIKFFGNPPMNIMFTLFLSIAMIFGIEKTKEIKDRTVAMFMAIIVILMSMNFALLVDYGVLGIMLIPLFYFYIETRTALAGALILILLCFMMPGLLFKVMIIPFGIFLLKLNPVASKPHSFKTGWIYYAYYPIHKLLIGLYMKYFM